MKVLSQATLISVKVDALEALASHGDAEAKTTLQTLMKDDNAGPAGGGSAGAAGRQAAAQRVAKLVSRRRADNAPTQTRMLATIKDAPGRGDRAARR